MVTGDKGGRYEAAGCPGSSRNRVSRNVGAAALGTYLLPLRRGPEFQIRPILGEALSRETAILLPLKSGAERAYSALPACR